VWLGEPGREVALVMLRELRSPASSARRRRNRRSRWPSLFSGLPKSRLFDGYESRPLLHIRRMEDGDAGVTLEVVEIEGEDSIHLMNSHRSNDSSIVNLNPGDTMLKYELSPSREDPRRFRKE